MTDSAENTRLKKHPEELDIGILNMIQNIHKLDHFDQLPEAVHINILRSVSDREEDVQAVINELKSRHIKWHKSCKNGIDNQKVKRNRDSKQRTPAQLKLDGVARIRELMQMQNVVIVLNQYLKTTHTPVNCVIQ